MSAVSPVSSRVPVSNGLENGMTPCVRIRSNSGSCHSHGVWACSYSWNRLRPAHSLWSPEIWKAGPSASIVIVSAR